DQNTSSFVGGRCMWFTRFGTTCCERYDSFTTPTLSPLEVLATLPWVAGTRTSAVFVTDGGPRSTWYDVFCVHDQNSARRMASANCVTSVPYVERWKIGERRSCAVVRPGSKRVPSLNTNRIGTTTTGTTVRRCDIRGFLPTMR